jgi:septum formation protein
MTGMSSSDCLYLGSQSSARRRLLDYAQIKYQIIAHNSNERLNYQPKDFQEQVLEIAKHKMQTLQFPDFSAVNSNYLYALTADTLVRNTVTGEIFGKPVDRQQAISMLISECQAPLEVLTGCCLNKFYWRKNKWLDADSDHWVSGAVIEFCVDNDSIEQYFSIFPYALQCSGAGVVEEHGLSYLKNISGSYTAVLGLPLYELRKSLKKMGFT